MTRMGELTNRDRLILLNRIPSVGSTRLRRLLDVVGDLERLCAMTATQLQQVEGIGPTLAQRIATGCRAIDDLQQEVRQADACGARIITIDEADFPPSLRTIHDPPLALYVQGALAREDETAVAIVGSRRASLYGLEVAERLAYDLALRGVTIVSGLARGIDAAAHRGALKADGRTLAILGSGLLCLYPPEHGSLARQIAAHGAVLSEYPLQMQPLSQNFPRRNRLISGLALGVIIVEASARSGALITADCALEQGREVFAVPGPIRSATSHGTHTLLKEGARLITCADDVLEELRLRPELVKISLDSSLGVLNRTGDAPAPAIARGGPGKLSQAEPSEIRVLETLSLKAPMDIDGVAAKSGLSMPQASALLLQLQLKHLVRGLPGKRFVRVA